MPPASTPSTEVLGMAGCRPDFVLAAMAVFADVMATMVRSILQMDGVGVGGT